MQLFLMANCFIFGTILTVGGVVLMIGSLVADTEPPKRRVLWGVGGFVAVQTGLALITQVANVPSQM